MKLTRVLKNGLIIFLLFFISTPSWSAGNTASVSYLEGSAFKSKDGKDWKPVMRGDFLGANESVKTGVRTRLELTLPDGSKVRFSENTLFKVESLLFTDEERGFEIKAFFGKVWSKVKKFKKASKPVSFSPEEDRSEWGLWNQETDKRIATLPNPLPLFRILLVPIFVTLLI